MKVTTHPITEFDGLDVPVRRDDGAYACCGLEVIGAGPCVVFALAEVEFHGSWVNDEVVRSWAYGGLSC